MSRSHICQITRAHAPSISGDEEILAGIIMYALRPNAELKEKVEAVLAKVFREHCDFDPERTISLPIR